MKSHYQKLHAGNDIEIPFLIERIFLNLIKIIFKKGTANIICNGKKLRTSPSKIRNKALKFPFTASLQYGTEVPSDAIRHIKEIKYVEEWKKYERNETVFVCRWRNCVETLQCTLQSNTTLIQTLIFVASFYAYSPQISQFADNCKYWDQEFLR